LLAQACSRQEKSDFRVAFEQDRFVEDFSSHHPFCAQCRRHSELIFFIHLLYYCCQLRNINKALKRDKIHNLVLWQSPRLLNEIINLMVMVSQENWNLKQSRKGFGRRS
jgi:hypothetical protein